MPSCTGWHFCLSVAGRANLPICLIFIAMKTKQITIPQPCNQPWSAMQQEGKEHFCSSCQKTVIDFTGYEDAAFLAYFQKTTETPCGRLTQRQLDLVIPVPPTFLFRPANLYKYAAAGLLSITGITTQAQTVATIPTAQNPVAAGNRLTTGEQAQQDTISFRARVVDENNEGVAGASVHIMNNAGGTVTDVDGNFYLSVSVRERNSGVLEIKSVGYTTIQTVMNTLTDHAIIKLAPSEQELIGEIVIIRKQNLWQRITRPFRNR